MAAVEVTITGVLYDKLNRTTQQVVLIGEASYTGLGIGGGPVIPPASPGVPTHPIYYPPGIWGPTDPRPTPPIANVPGIDNPNPPGFGAHPEHPIVIPPNEIPPDGPADDSGFIKPPPEGGGWGYHPTYGWMYDPPTSKPGPK